MSARIDRENRAREARYAKSTAAEAEVNRRVQLALGRLRVALDFDAGTSAVVAQSLHALHFIERGWASKWDSRTIPPSAPDFHIGHEEAETVVQGLASMLEQARQAKSTAGQAE